MTNTLKQAVSEVEDFASLTQNVIRMYAEFGCCSKEDLKTWLKLALNLQKKDNCPRLDKAIEELQRCLNS